MKFIKFAKVDITMNKQTCLIILILMLIVAGCTQQQNIPQTGFLQGKITIGPLCPVERNPPDPKCSPNTETYKAWQMAVYSPNNEIVSLLEPDLTGNYKIELPVGSYMIDFESKKNFGVGRSNLPTTIKISKNETTTLDIDIDTGIR